MARYPELPKFVNTEAEAKEFYEYVQQWGAALINELETRDTQVNANPSSNIYAVVTITEIGSPQRGDIAYAASAGKFKGYVSTTATQAWENLN
jgi:hypothetical protein|tara:strand:- start:9633 stop:9911 length:279 start_codon:yes stop_codon:yes gene_type:complete